MDVNENHRRNIFTTLWLVDKALCEFRSWAEGRERKSVLYKEINNLNRRQKSAVLREVETMQSVLRNLQTELRLKGRAESAAKSIGAQTTSLWLYLSELNEKSLRGYGEPPPELLAFLEPNVRELLKGVQDLADIVGDEAARGPI